jgi:branched-chain amino acid transport system substrate-binding protein
MKRKCFKSLTTLLLVGSFLFSIGLGKAMAAEAPDSIRVGIVLPLSGPAAWAGISLKNGSELVVDEVNAQGGVFIKEFNKKIPVKVFYEDCQSKPAIGVAVAEKLITKIRFIIWSAMPFLVL